MAASSSSPAPAVVPTVCSTCLGDDVAITMVKAARAGACKFCQDPFDQFRWKASPKTPLKVTQICERCAAAQHLCPSCLLDYDYRLTKPVRDATIGLPTAVQPVLAVGYTALQSPYARPDEPQQDPLLLTHQDKTATLARLVQQQAAATDRSRPATTSPTTLWIGSLPDTVTVPLLQSLLAEFGAVRAVRLVAEHHCAFIEFAHADSATAALTKLGRSLTIDGHAYPLRPARLHHQNATSSHQQQHQQSKKRGPVGSSSSSSFAKKSSADDAKRFRKQ